jgi:cell division protein FtsW (lipid II flippase)
LSILIALATLLIPDWIIQNIREIIRYTSYNPPGTLSAVFKSLWPSFGSRVGITLTVLVIAMLLVEWWLTRKADMNRFLWTACLTLVGSQWAGIQTDAGNFIIMLPALVLIFSIITERWKKFGEVVILGIMVVLMAGLWIIFISTLQQLDQPVQSPIMFLLLPAFLLVMLYWVKWWIVRPPSVWYDEITPQHR